MRVLIIEDEPLNQMVFEDALAAAGHEVTVIGGAFQQGDQLIGFGNDGDLPLDLSAFDYAVVGDETAKYLAKLLRERK